jgi:signal transduction histidine kinase
MKLKTGITLWLSIVICIVIVAGFSMSYFVSDYFKQTILKRDVDVNAKFIALQAKQHLTPEDFAPKDFDKKDKKYSQFFNEIDTDEIVRIKVWSTNQVVIYSDDKAIVGKPFHDNDELNESLDGGEVVTEISSLTKSESTSEKNFGQLIEMYIPIKSNSGKIIGVIETYASLDTVNAYIENANKIIFLGTLSSIIVVVAIIMMTFKTFRRNLINPILGIQKHTKLIAEGKWDIKSQSVGYDEVKNLGNQVEIMSSKLKEQQVKITKTERLSAIGELAARLAHDLRNPLSIIRNSLILIRHRFGSDPESVEYFNRIDRSIYRMSHQLENVMDFVTTKEFKVSSNDINAIIKNALEKANIPDSIKVNLSTEDITLDCDQSKLEVVFDNILVNAKQAIGSSGTINIRVNKEPDWVKIEIQDSGHGIPDDVLPKIFEPLFTTKQEGTGLGLPSCKNIIEQHGGSISVKTELDKGTTFIITLPIKPLQKQMPQISSK